MNAAADKCFLDSTGLVSWTVVELAIEVLSACLPTMAPLTKLKQHLPKVRDSLRALFSSHKPSQQDDLRGREQCKRDLDQQVLRPDRNAKVKSTAHGGTFGERELGSDIIPLNSIGFKQDIDWIEERC